MKDTLVVNLIGGQGTGKSTIMANLFAWLKWHNVDCEMCSEFAKELVWEERKETFKDELYIFAKQNHRLFRCNGKVDVIITDRPLIMSVVYNRAYGNPDKVVWNTAYEYLIRETFHSYNNFNILLNRVKPFNPNGRNETEEQAKEFDKMFKEYLDMIDMPYIRLDGTENTVPIIGNLILNKINHERNN